MTAGAIVWTLAGLFVVVVLMLRKIPARPGNREAGGTASPSPVVDHDPMHSPHWHHRHDGASDAMDHTPGGAGGSSSDSGSGSGGGGHND